MPMKYFLSLLLIVITANAFCQSEEFSKPDYKLIEKNVGDKKSPYYFNTLFERYKKADSTMTVEDRRHLYYGYSFQDSYSPYGIPNDYESLNEILMSQKTDSKTLEKLIKVSANVLRDYPFSIRVKEYRIYAFKQLGRLKEARAEEKQAAMIIDAILSTGDGSKENSFYVISTTNEYELLDILGFKFGGEQSIVEGRYDYLTLEENPYELKGMYFEVSRLFESFGLD